MPRFTEPGTSTSRNHHSLPALPQRGTEEHGEPSGRQTSQGEHNQDRSEEVVMRFQSVCTYCACRADVVTAVPPQFKHCWARRHPIWGWGNPTRREGPTSPIQSPGRAVTAAGHSDFLTCWTRRQARRGPCRPVSSPSLAERRTPATSLTCRATKPHAMAQGARGRCRCTSVARSGRTADPSNKTDMLVFRSSDTCMV